MNISLLMLPLPKSNAVTSPVPVALRIEDGGAAHAHQRAGPGFGEVSYSFQSCDKAGSVRLRLGSVGFGFC